MDPLQAKQQMTLAEFRSLRDFIYAKSGIFFSESKQYFLENRLSKRIGELKLRSYAEYLSLLQGSQGPAELKRLFVEITTNETSFWRNPPQIEAFQNIVLPDAAKQARERGQSRLRIWSAACSSGEEPYTLAMICQELKDTVLRGLSVEILATDISEKVLAQAQDAVYNSYTLRNLTPEQLTRHFLPLGKDLFQLKPEVQRLATLKNFNLVDYPAYRQLGSFDVIFCRNVIIYFDRPTQQRILKKISQYLLPGGYLFVGHAETLHDLDLPLAPVAPVLYRRIDAGA